MKKTLPTLIALLLLPACTTPVEPRPEALPVTQFETADCSTPMTAESTLVEWEWIKFELPWCWSAQVLPDSDQPILVLKDQEEGASGLLVLTYDPNQDPYELKTNTLTPENPDIQFILNSFQE